MRVKVLGLGAKLSSCRFRDGQIVNFCDTG